MRTPIVVCLLLLGLPRLAPGQDVTIGPAAYGQFVTGDLSEFGQPLMTEVRASSG